MLPFEGVKELYVKFRKNHANFFASLFGFLFEVTSLVCLVEAADGRCTDELIPLFLALRPPNFQLRLDFLEVF